MMSIARWICRVCFWIVVAVFVIAMFDAIVVFSGGVGGCRLGGNVLAFFQCPDTAFPRIWETLLNLPLFLFVYGPMVPFLEFANPVRTLFYFGNGLLVLGLAYPFIVIWGRRRQRSAAAGSGGRADA